MQTQPKPQKYLVTYQWQPKGHPKPIVYYLAVDSLGMPEWVAEKSGAKHFDQTNALTLAKASGGQAIQL